VLFGLDTCLTPPFFLTCNVVTEMWEFVCRCAKKAQNPEEKSRILRFAREGENFTLCGTRTSLSHSSFVPKCHTTNSERNGQTWLARSALIGWRFVTWQGKQETRRARPRPLHETRQNPPRAWVLASSSVKKPASACATNDELTVLLPKTCAPERREAYFLHHLVKKVK
jgi:hypothetical protein